MSKAELLIKESGNVRLLASSNLDQTNENAILDYFSNRVLIIIFEQTCYMEIIIQDKNAFQHTIEGRLVLWQIYFKKNIKTYLIQCVLGIFLLILGLPPLNTSVSETEYVNNMTHQSETTYHRNTVNFVGAIAIAYIFLLIVSFITFWKRKKAFLSEAKRLGKLTFNRVNESTLTIGDEGIVYQTPTSRTDCNWIIFSHFSLYKDYLLLNLDQSGLQAYLINKHLLSEKEFQDLLIFVRQKLRQK
jgi:hypothetical protein